MKATIVILLAMAIISGCIKSESTSSAQKSQEIPNQTQINESSEELKSMVRSEIIKALEKGNLSGGS